MAVPEGIQPLVDKYTFHRDAYLRGKGGDYNEAQLRQDFTDPFFHALGWLSTTTRVTRKPIGK